MKNFKLPNGEILSKYDMYLWDEFAQGNTKAVEVDEPVTHYVEQIKHDSGLINHDLLPVKGLDGRIEALHFNSPHLNYYPRMLEYLLKLPVAEKIQAMRLNQMGHNIWVYEQLDNAEIANKAYYMRTEDDFTHCDACSELKLTEHFVKVGNLKICADCITARKSLEVEK